MSETAAETEARVTSHIYRINRFKYSNASKPATENNKLNTICGSWAAPDSQCDAIKFLFLAFERVVEKQNTNTSVRWKKK